MDISSLPELINNALFDGNPEMLTVSGLIISVLVVFMFMFPLIMAEVEMYALAILVVLITALLTGIGWLDPYVFMTILLLIVLIFANKISRGIFG